nr:hypothetical protein [Tanacetum cinerariifolium]
CIGRSGPSLLRNKVKWPLIFALEELATLATNLARKQKSYAADRWQLEWLKWHEKLHMRQMAQKLRNLREHDVMLRQEARNAAEPKHFGMVPKVQSQENMRSRTFMAAPGIRGVPRLSSSHDANMGAGQSEAESMIREVEEAARKLKAKVVDTHTIPAGQKGRKIEGAQSLTCF